MYLLPKFHIKTSNSGTSISGTLSQTLNFARGFFPAFSPLSVDRCSCCQLSSIVARLYHWASAIVYNAWSWRRELVCDSWRVHCAAVDQDVECRYKTDVTRAVLSRHFVAQLYRAIKSQVWHAVSHTATLSHKQELASQRSPRIFATKLRRTERCFNRKRSCATVEKLRDTPRHTCDFVARWSCATKSRDKIARVKSDWRMARCHCDSWASCVWLQTRTACRRRWSTTLRWRPTFQAGQ